MDHQRADLTDRWPLDDAFDLRDAIVAAYDDDVREYHDLRHLCEVVDRVLALQAAGVGFDAVPVLLAAWFHDGVYDGERDAEERSATWAEDALPGLVDDAVVAEVARLVRLTETHRPDDDDTNGCVLSDADLGILAAPAARYEEYATSVRREYGHLDDEVFRAGRTAVLTDLLAKPRLFHTTRAFEQWEDPARANAQAELARLASH